MMKLKALVKRNLLQTLLDPLSLIFCLGFPIVMLVLLQTIFASMEFVPPNFEIQNYAIGICVFGYTFTMMFTAMNVAEDKNSQFIMRINMAPVKKSVYLFSFMVSSMPVAFVQTVIFLLISLIFGFEFSVNLPIALGMLVPSMIFYVSFGVLLGALCKTEKQAGPICSILISATAMLGGVFMPIDNLGIFSTIVNFLPFTHTVKVASELYSSGILACLPHLFWVLGYSLAIWILIIIAYKLKKE